MPFSQRMRRGLIVSQLNMPALERGDITGGGLHHLPRGVCAAIPSCCVTWLRGALRSGAGFPGSLRLRLKIFSVETLYNNATLLHLHLCIYRRFYPKRLTIAFRYTFSLVCVFPGNRTHNLLRCWHNALPLRHTGTLIINVLLLQPVSTVGLL